MNNEPRAMKEIHEIQEKIHEELKNKSIKDRLDFFRKASEEAEKIFGLKLKKAIHTH